MVQGVPKRGDNEDRNFVFFLFIIRNNTKDTKYLYLIQRHVLIFSFSFFLDTLYYVFGIIEPHYSNTKKKKKSVVSTLDRGNKLNPIKEILFLIDDSTG